MEIDAPYGCKLKDYPSKPQLYPTDIYKSVVQPLPLLGTIVGTGLLIGGAVTFLSNQKNGHVINQQKENGARAMLAIGFVLDLFSAPEINTYVPDNEKNNENKSLNEEFMYKWQQEYNRIENINNLIKATFTIRFNTK